MPVPQIQGVSSQVRRPGPQKVFVYGTLKQGFGNHEYHLKESKFLGSGYVDGLMFHLGAYPAINLSDRFTRIQGEVYEATWDQIASMDRLEGVDSGFYSRIETSVDSHGIAWTYIYPYHKAIKEQWVVPSGVWRGPDTLKVRWDRFGKGIEIGAFETRKQEDEIKVGAGESDYVLRRSPLDNSYKLINKKTREVIGSYTHLRDMVGADGIKKPVLRLPAASRPSGDAIARTIVSLPPSPSTVALQQHPSVPIVWTPQRQAAADQKKEEESIPQAARLLGIKYGEA